MKKTYADYCLETRREFLQLQIESANDVPELARRLKKACSRLRDLSMKRRDYEFVDELEAPFGRRNKCF